MIGRYNLGTFFSFRSNWYLIISTLASHPSTAKNGTWVRNEVRDRVISNHLIPYDFATIHWCWWSTLKVHHPVRLAEFGLLTISITDRYRLLELHGVSCNPRTIRSPLFWFDVYSIWYVNRSKLMSFQLSFPFCQICMIHLSLWADSEENATW